MASSSELPPGYLEEYSGDQLLIASGMILGIATVLLALRFYVRTALVVTKGWDDFLLLPSWLLLVALGIIFFISVPKGGAGTHVQAVDDARVVTLFKIIYLNFWFYYLSSLLSRISVILLYLRIFTSKTARRLCWVTMIYLVVQTFANLIAANVQCQPMAYTWDKSIPGGHCFNVLLWWKLLNFPNLVADFAILLLPLRTVWTLKASVTRKLGILVVFLTGSVGTVVTIIRTVLFFTLNLKGDPTWQAVPTFMLSIVECGMYLFAACLIGLRPLIPKIPQWVKLHAPVTTRTATTRKPTYGFSRQLRSSRGGTNHFSWQADKSRGVHEQDSMTNIVHIDADAEMRSLDTRENTEVPTSSDDIGKIRVKTTIDVETQRRESNYTRYEFA